MNWRSFAATLLSAAALLAAGPFQSTAETPKRLKLCLRAADGKISVKERCRTGVEQVVDAQALSALMPTVQGVAGQPGSEGPQGPQGPEGVQGPAGKDGILGYVAISQDFIQQINSTQYLTFNLACPGGRVVLGGGCKRSTSAILVETSYPINQGTAWSCQYFNSFPNALTPTFTVYAQCGWPN